MGRTRRRTGGGQNIPATLSWTQYSELTDGPNPRSGVFEHFPEREQRVAIYKHHALNKGERLGLNECCRPFAWYEARGLDRYKLPEPGSAYPPSTRPELVFLLEGGHLDASEREYADRWIHKQRELKALRESTEAGITSRRARRDRSATRE